MLETAIQSDAKEIIDEYGLDVTVYLSPTYNLDDEGAASISKGTGNSVKALIFATSGVLVTPQMEGIDTQKIWRCFLPYDVGTITDQSIIEWNSEYYKINSINSNQLGTADVVFYELEIELIQPQNSVS